MSPDRGHLHHRLIDMGLSQKQTVAIMYVIAMILGLSAVMVVGRGAYTAIILIASAMIFTFFGGKMFIEHKIAENKSENTEKDGGVYSETADQNTDFQEEGNEDD